MPRKRRAPSAAAAPGNGGVATLRGAAPEDPQARGGLATPRGAASEDPQARGGPATLRGAAPEDPQARIAAIQRARLLTGVAQACSEHGVANLTIGQIVARSGVSRRTFYENFQSREDCLLAAVEQALTRLAERVTPAFNTPGSWLERMRAAVLGTLELFDEEPHTARLLIVETLGSGNRALHLRQTVLANVIAAIDQARDQAKGAEPPAWAAEGALGGALAVLHARLLEPEPGPLVGLTGQLMSMLVMPYLGASAARRELVRPLPQSVPRTPLPPNPLAGLGMRLTYRTVRVLFAVAAHPDASNRELATAAGIHDQGQASKLLMRLQRLGLIENNGAGIRHGAPNAWALTHTGTQVQQAIGVQDPAARGRGSD